MESTILFIGEKHFAGTAAGSVIFCLRKKTVIGKIYAMQLIFCQLLKVHRHVSLIWKSLTKRIRNHQGSRGLFIDFEL